LLSTYVPHPSPGSLFKGPRCEGVSKEGNKEARGKRKSEKFFTQMDF
jgi:hypothetical protein